MIAELVREREIAPGDNDGLPVTTAADVDRINRALAAWRNRFGSLRLHKAFFRCEWPCSRRHYETVRYAATARWVADQEKRGFVLRSKVHVNTKRRQPAHGYSGDFASGVLLDQVEIPIRAFFEKLDPKPMRIEIALAPN